MTTETTNPCEHGTFKPNLCVACVREREAVEDYLKAVNLLEIKKILWRAGWFNYEDHEDVLSGMLDELREALKVTPQKQTVTLPAGTYHISGDVRLVI